MREFPSLWSMKVLECRSETSLVASRNPTAVLPGHGNDPTAPDRLYLMGMVSVVGALSPHGLFRATFSRGLEASGRLAIFGVTPPLR